MVPSPDTLWRSIIVGLAVLASLVLRSGQGTVSPLAVTTVQMPICLARIHRGAGTPAVANSDAAP